MVPGSLVTDDVRLAASLLLCNNNDYTYMTVNHHLRDHLGP